MNEDIGMDIVNCLNAFSLTQIKKKILCDVIKFEKGIIRKRCSSSFHTFFQRVSSWTSPNKLKQMFSFVFPPLIVSDL